MRNWDDVPAILYKYDVEIFLIAIYMVMVAMWDYVLGLPGTIGFTIYLLARRKRKG